jgi:hypothetical protein
MMVQRTTTNRLATVALSGLLATALMATTAFAHHSASMYDPTKPKTLTGTIKQFRWINPHVVVVLTTAATSGAPATNWAVEMSSPGNMTHLGWAYSSLKPGQKVSIEVSPMRDGTPGGACRIVTFLEKGTKQDCGLGNAILAAEKPNIK